MKEFVEKFPQFKSVQTNAVKHMTLAGELGRIINTRNLLDTTELEQELATTDNHEEVVPKVVPGPLFLFSVWFVSGRWHLIPRLAPVTGKVPQRSTVCGRGPAESHHAVRLAV